MSIFEEYGAFKGTGYTYPPFLQGGVGGSNFLLFPVGCPAHQSSLERINFKRKEFAPNGGANSFLLK